ncbi:MAG: hypothetical protein IT288_12010 [Bdellovibrionales bacterium]|nr:hypothetical protein [Bdellovibrionales bacterium]
MMKWLLVLSLVAPLTACLEDKEKSDSGAEVMVDSTTQDGTAGQEQQPAAQEAAPAEETPANQ